MANTFSFSSVLDHTNDAGYNAWVAELIDALFTEVGLTQSADTGQTAGTGLTRPSANVSNAYVVAEFNDTLAGTRPISILFEFGSGNNPAISPCLWATIGSGSNGSGVITGVLIPRFTLGGSFPPSNAVTSYMSRMVWNPTLGFFALAWKQNAQGIPGSLGGCIIARSNDNTGVATNEGLWVLCNSLDTPAGTGGNNGSQGQFAAYNYVAAARVTIPQPIEWTPGQVYPFRLTTSTLPGGDVQIAPIFVVYGPIRPPVGCGIAIIAEVPQGNIAHLALVGATAHDYLSVGNPFGGTAIGNSGTGNWSLCFLWE